MNVSPPSPPPARLSSFPLLSSVRIRLFLIVMVAVVPVALVELYAEAAHWTRVNQLLNDGMVLILALAIIYVLGQVWFVRPMRALLAAAHRWANGDWSARVDAGPGGSDFAHLAQALNAMAAALQQRTTQLTRANRALRTRSECNQALMRAENEPALLQQVCAMLADVGGYRLAWVGFVEHDADQSVRPRAHAGAGSAYVNHVLILGTAPEFGLGPTDVAIRTGRPAIVRNIASEPDYAPWREQALAHGFASFMALPLVVSGQSIGALNLYAAEPEAFDDDEARLLTELADDLSYGLTAFRARAAQAEAEAERQQAEAVLQKSEERYRSLFENMLNGFAYCQMLYENDAPQDFIYRAVNRTFEKLTGLQDVVGRKVSDVIPGIRQSDPGLFELYGRVARTGAPEQVELYLEALHAWYAISVYRPEPEHFVAVFDVITTRKRVEEALRESEGRFTAFMSNLPAAAFVKEAAGRTLFMNAYLQRLLNVQDWEGKITPELVAGDIGQQMAEDDRRALAHGLLTIQETLVDPAGVARNFETIKFPIRVEGQPVLLGGISIDVTERNRAEADLRQSEAQLRQAQRVAHVGSWAWKIRSNQLEWSEEMYRIFGIEKESFTGSLSDVIAQAIHPEDRAKVEASNTSVMRDGKPYPLEYRVLWPDQSVHTVWGEAGQLTLDEAGQPAVLTGIVQDITERKRVEEEIRALNAELEQRVAERTAELEAANRELETFTYSVSHDLKAPLRGLDGYSRLLLEDHTEHLNDEGRFFARSIRQAAKQMSQLIDDLLTYSRWERRTFASRAVAPRDVVELVLRERADEMRARGVVLQVELPTTTVTVEPEGLAQALRNLLDNALKFTRHTAEPRIEFGGQVTDQACLLWVRDNGIGFDPEHHDRIFEIFQRLHRVEDYPGTGVGLAIVRKVMHRLGGRAWADSRPGFGATFYLEIPQ